MAFELSGKLIEKFDTQQVSEKFRKREFVIEKEENVGENVFTDLIKFQLTQDRCDLLDGMNVNDLVKISFNIRGRKWEKEGRVNYFTNLEAWRIESAGSGDHSSTTAGEDFVPDKEPNDDLPF